VDPWVIRKGRWVTIGAHGDGDDARGGTPVYIENGKITRGPSHLVGHAPDKIPSRRAAKKPRPSPESSTGGAGMQARKEQTRKESDKRQPELTRHPGMSSIPSEPPGTPGAKQEGKKMDAAPQRIVHRSSQRSVDAYRPGEIIEHPAGSGQYVKIARYARSADDQGGYAHKMDVVPATEEESKPIRIRALKRQIAATGAEARREPLDAELRRLEGRPTKAAEAEQRKQAVKVEALAILDKPRSDRNMHSHWGKVATALYMVAGKAHSAVTAAELSDDEIRAMLAGGQ
jgi:hypothetical protein